ncbi:Retinal guanylyl cyclase 2 [Trichoplax sp. H2]|nr:Retinal guanylyl cyclase 2 [Trichoplax sp. H2]|eukprot:RDD47547.1 Retinal guanylyl cyclase 2 [Trichoplax sp. H2]
MASRMVVLTLLLTGPFCLMVLCNNSSSQQTQLLHIGLMIPTSGGWIAPTHIIPGADIAIETVNNDSSVLVNYRLYTTLVNSGCTTQDSLTAMANLWRNKQQPVRSFVGPACSVGCEPGGILAAAWNVPMISWGCASPSLSDKKKFATFTRTSGPYSAVGKLIQLLVKHYNWTRVGLLTSLENAWQVVAIAIKQGAPQGIKFEQYNFQTGVGLSNDKKVPLRHKAELLIQARSK